MTATILVVDDHDDVRSLLKDVLKEDYQVVEANNGISALSMISKYQPDLIVLDLMLPEVTGESVLKTLRKSSDIPVIVLTEIQNKAKVVELLETGANDYLTKPFDIDELLARVKVQLRQKSAQLGKKTILTYDKISLNQVTHQVKVENQDLILPKKEFEILQIFLNHPHQVFPKEQLYETVWGEPYLNGENTLNVHLSNLRLKIANLTGGNQYIKSIWGIGVKFD